MRTTDYVSKLMSIAQSANPNESIEARIAQTMLAHLKELGSLQNQEIASLCFVDAATISRFVRSLGFLKYGEFKSYFRDTMKFMPSIIFIRAYHYQPLRMFTQKPFMHLHIALK